MIPRTAHRPVRAAAAVAAHPRWRPERDAVRAAYGVWTATTACGEPLAIEAYQSTLDREANTYTRLMRRVRHHGSSLADPLSGGLKRQKNVARSFPCG
jgi:hypothetical protein